MGTYLTEEGAGDAGTLAIGGKNISFDRGAVINANTTGRGKGGDVNLIASESVSFSGETSKAGVSRIMVNTQYEGEGAGDAGTLTIEAKNISFTDGAYIISSNTLGKGKGGEVTLKAAESVSFSGESGKAEASRISVNTHRISVNTQYEGEDAGDAGKVTVEAKNISFTEGAYINSDTSGKGRGGEVSLKASESVSFSGENSKAEASRILIETQYEREGAGDAGKLTIDAKNIFFSNGAAIFSNSTGKGKGGEVSLKADKTFSFAGESSKGGTSRIWINTKDEEKGAGDAGKLSVEAENILFMNGAGISSNTFGKGNGGEMSLKATESVSFAGENSRAGVSRIETGTAGSGDAGILTLEARDISFTEGAYINSNTTGKGKGGEISLKASESVSFSGENSKAEASAIGIETSDMTEEAGDAGKLTIEAKNISFTDGTGITSNTYGKGNGGEISLKASESVSFSGEDSNAKVSQILLVSTHDKEEGAGDAGKLTVEAKNISFTGGALINSTTYGKGGGGGVMLKATESVSFSGENSEGYISAIALETKDIEEGAGNAGKLTVEAGNISFTKGALINSNTSGKGKGGEVALKASESVSFSGENSEGYPSVIVIT